MPCRDNKLGLKFAFNQKMLYLCTSKTENSAKEQRNIAGWSSWLACRAHNPEVGGSSPPPATKRGKSRDLSLFLLPSEARSACCASADLSACCVGGASLCDYDVKSRYHQVNRFPCQYRLFTSDLRSCTTSPPLGLLSASAAVRVLFLWLRVLGEVSVFFGGSVSLLRLGRLICASKWAVLLAQLWNIV